MTPDVRPLTNGANGAIIASRCNTRQRAPSTEGNPVKVQLNYLGVADVTLIRYCLTYYEAELAKAVRTVEDAAVTQSVVQTVETLQRLDRRLRAWVYKVDEAIDNYTDGEAKADDIPF